jgi:hypothetical protein
MKLDKNKVYILMCSLAGAIFTWFLNHKLGYGAIVANGLVGIVAAILLPTSLSSVTFTSSFVGMSSTAVIPSLSAAALGGLIVGLIIMSTKEIYAGIGGKGGTTAALASLITKTILGLIS